ncbi:MAG: hypothetical protein ABIE22_00675 [archaeon]
MNPALFYFWAHSEYNELDTEKARELIERADVIFEEHVSSDFAITDEIERDFKAFIERGIVSEKLAVSFLPDYLPNQTEFILGHARERGKRIVLERTLEADFDVNGGDEECIESFIYEEDWKRAFEMAKVHAKRNQIYQTKREADVAEQIVAIPETTMVLFGAGHPELEKRVATKRPTEVHFPYEDYPTSFDCQLNQKFRETGELDEELFFRRMMEGMALRAFKDLNGGISSRVTDLTAYRYAEMLAPEQVLDYKNYMMSCSRFLGFSKLDIFESYLKKEGLPQIEEVMGEFTVSSKL